MIAFYAVSNLAIFNAVNVKEQYYPSDSADLFVRFVNGTTLELVESVRENGIFENVFLVNFPQIDTHSGFLGKWNSLRILGYGKKYQLFIDRYLDTMVKGKKYDVLLTLHMDSHCLYFADYFRRSNKQISIEFFEDGTASYLCTRKYLALRPIRLGDNMKAYIAKCIYENRTRKRLRHNISKVLYIYAPEVYDSEMGFSPKSLKMGGTSRSILAGLGNGMDNALRLRYEKRNWYYIANAKTKSEPNYDFAYSIIDSIMECLGRDKLIIKTHSSASTDNKLNFGKQYEKVAFVDRNVYLLEGLLLSLPDLDHKVIIARATTTMMLPKLWMDKEPYIILTLRLYPYYGQHGDPGGDEYIEMLRSLYSDPSRIYVPNTLGDLKVMLREIQRRIHADRYGIMYTYDQSAIMIDEDAMPEWRELSAQWQSLAAQKENGMQGNGQGERDTKDE